MAISLTIGIIILVVVIVLANNKRNELLSEGKIINRPIDFVEKAEIFRISKLSDYTSVVNGVMNFDYNDIKCSLDGDKAKQTYNFKGSDWTAKLWLIGNEENETIYRFEFGRWSERNGIPYSGVAMNKLETAIEKLFLSIDVNTKVSTEKIEFKTRHGF